MSSGMLGGVAGVRFLDVSKRRFIIFFTVNQPDKFFFPKDKGTTTLRNVGNPNPTKQRNIA
jgi:hypothetical protein